MAVSFNAANEYIRFTSPTNALGHTSKTYAMRSGALTRTPFFQYYASGDTIKKRLTHLANMQIEFTANFTTTNGVWVTNSVGISSNIIITYNGGSASNNPIIYVDGVSVTVTKTTSPVGTYVVPATRIDLGFPGAIITGDTVLLEDFRIYNVIKTAPQVSVIASEDLFTDQNIDETGLVFHAPLTMCKGLTYDTFSGSTLATANEFYDRVNGYLGVPNGSPVGA